MSDEQASETALAALQRAQEAHTLGLINQERQNTHEEQCAERYQGILDGIAQLRKWLIGAAGTVIVLLLGAVATLTIMWVNAVISGAGS